jgi:hypothetical protein
MRVQYRKLHDKRERSSGGRPAIQWRGLPTAVSWRIYWPSAPGVGPLDYVPPSKASGKPAMRQINAPFPRTRTLYCPSQECPRLVAATATCCSTCHRPLLEGECDVVKRGSEEVECKSSSWTNSQPVRSGTRPRPENPKVRQNPKTVVLLPFDCPLGVWHGVWHGAGNGIWPDWPGCGSFMLEAQQPGVMSG